MNSFLLPMLQNSYISSYAATCTAEYSSYLRSDSVTSRESSNIRAGLPRFMCYFDSNFCPVLFLPSGLCLHGRFFVLLISLRLCCIKFFNNKKPYPAMICGYLARIQADSIPPYDPPKAITGVDGSKVMFI